MEYFICKVLLNDEYLLTLTNCLSLIEPNSTWYTGACFTSVQKAKNFYTCERGNNLYASNPAQINAAVNYC